MESLVKVCGLIVVVMHPFLVSHALLFKLLEKWQSENAVLHFVAKEKLQCCLKQ